METRGASAKVWVREPAGSSTRPESDWLFKPVTTHRDGSVQVGDWTEVVASRVARSLEVPAAEALLAVRHGIPGVILRNVRPAGYDMVTGRLAMLDEIDVETRDSRRQKSASIGHSLENVRLALDRYGPPPGATSWEGCTAFDVMTGYLVVDALIGNGDRHEQNWSVLRAQSISNAGSDALAPTYDMEASLGFQLTDGAREARLRDAGSIEAFVLKGLARRFEGDLDTSLVDLAARSFAMCSATGRARLKDLVGDIVDTDFEQIVEAEPSMSEVTRTFALKVLELNERRIHNAISS
ncbi:HipA domain-containing protein [Salinibacterium sp.]|uniref:HipA domain-containing protein n=1 Tax=Salinibacterium sp. TaxID=1915057 RepID=UPI00286C737E|nr:HipA domain-containing protein [Salinibacterium sp.]